MNRAATSSPVKERRLLLALSAFALLNTVLWAVTIPPDQSPDEAAHIDVVRFEAKHHRIPEVGVDDPAATISRAADGYLYPYYTYSAQPGLSYIIDAALVAGSGATGAAAYGWARIPGMLFAGAMPLIVFWAARGMTGRRDVALFSAMLVALWPELTFVFSYVNNDGLTVLLSSATIGSWYSGLQYEWRPRDVALAAVLTGLLLINKQNGFFVAVGTPLALLLTMRQPRKMGRLALAAAIIVVVSGWWYAIATARYGTDLFASARAAAALARLHGEWPSARHYHIGFVEMLFKAVPRFGASWVSGTARSAFGMFGAMNLALPDSCYQIALFFVLIGLVGMVRAAGTLEKFDRRTILHLLTAGAFVTVVLASLWRSWSFDFQPQGRHLFPVLMPFLVMLALGLLSLFDNLRAQQFVVLGVALSLMGINALALLTTLVGANTPGIVGWFAMYPVAVVLWSIALVGLTIATLQAWSVAPAVAAAN
jgi:4-amino-4-deoxy-L-arabinose transferase-like glycosyltransferase